MLRIIFCVFKLNEVGKTVTIDLGVMRDTYKTIRRSETDLNRVLVISLKNIRVEIIDNNFQEFKHKR